MGYWLYRGENKNDSKGAEGNGWQSGITQLAAAGDSPVCCCHDDNTPGGRPLPCYGYGGCGALFYCNHGTYPAFGLCRPDICGACCLFWHRCLCLRNPYHPVSVFTLVSHLSGGCDEWGDCHPLWQGYVQAPWAHFSRDNPGHEPGVLPPGLQCYRHNWRCHGDDEYPSSYTGWV
ncbi:hypothetical protein ES703_50873 [subsurface metagenome]